MANNLPFCHPFPLPIINFLSLSLNFYSLFPTNSILRQFSTYIHSWQKLSLLNSIPLYPEDRKPTQCCIKDHFTFDPKASLPDGHFNTSMASCLQQCTPTNVLSHHIWILSCPLTLLSEILVPVTPFLFPLHLESHCITTTLRFHFTWTQYQGQAHAFKQTYGSLYLHMNSIWINL